MSTWTAIPTSVLEVGQPIRSIDIIALRDNILAVPAGAAGAPRVQGAALANPLTMPGNLRIENAAPLIVFRETDQVLPAGLWRVVLDGNRWDIRRNTAPAGDFTTENTPFSIAPDDTVTVNGNNLNLFNTRSHAANGWQRLPGGLLIQWGSNLVPALTTVTANFPIAFPTACLRLIAGSTIDDNMTTVGGVEISSTQYRVRHVDQFANLTINWIAIGF